MPEITVAGTNIRQISASSKKIRIPSGAPRPGIGTVIGFFTGFFNYFSYFCINWKIMILNAEVL